LTAVLVIIGLVLLAAAASLAVGIVVVLPVAIAIGHVYQLASREQRDQLRGQLLYHYCDDAYADEMIEADPDAAP
jgi:hypothetical protein